MVINNKEIKIAVIGLGYVGLPLAVEFGKKFQTVGYDINKNRIKELNKGEDQTLEVSKKNLKASLENNNFLLTDNVNEIIKCNFYIITVPTPTDKNNRPILTPLLSASESVGKVIDKGDFIVYESTVYPGCTEEDCLPILEKESGLELNSDFYIGYSPERINPGDKKHTVTKILKITSGSNDYSSKTIDLVYSEIIKAGTHLAPSIKVAEAAKVIENSQRDINIAFVNELSKIFSLMNIDTYEVLEAASTKWNFLNFKPGLVGGHCIGVDPYYLAQKSQEVGYNPEIILSGRRLNDGMSEFIANQTVKLLIQNDFNVKNSKVLILGVTFKENCPDFRNTKVTDLIDALSSYGVNITIHDPWVDKKLFKKEYGHEVFNKLDKGKYDGIILAVSHNDFRSIDLETLKSSRKSIIYDIKGFFDKNLVTKRL